MASYKALCIETKNERVFVDVIAANAEAQMMSCETGTAYVFKDENTFPEVIYLDGWPFYPAITEEGKRKLP